jgi:hypothetical protein
VKSLVSSLAAGADRIIWYQLYDRYLPGEYPAGCSSEAFFGVAYPDNSLKSGGEAIARLAPVLRKSTLVPELLALKQPGNIPSVIYPFLDSEGIITAVAWSRFGRMEVELKGFRDGALIYETGTGKETVWHPGSLVSLSPEPLIIRGDSSGNISFQ